MTIPATSRVSPIYQGNASATSFAFAFKTYAKSELQVIVSDGVSPVTLTLDVDYSVTLNSDQVNTPGGSITYPISGSPLASGKTLVVVSAVPNSQQVSLPTGGAFNASVVELALDRQQVQVQQLSDIANRTIRAPAGETFTGTLPAALARANSLSAFDNTGQPTAIPYGFGNFTGTVSSQALREKQTATAGQTTFTLTTIAVATGAVQVFVDGFELPASDITVNTATSVTISSALLVGQEVEFVTNTFSTFGSGKTTITHVSSSTTDVGTLNIQRTAATPGGTFGFVNSAIRADTFVAAGVTSFEWCITGVVHNSATAGENVAGYFQGNRLSTGPTWGAVIECIDFSGGDPTTGSVTLELDVRGNGTDVNKARIGIDIAATVLDGSAPTQTMTAYAGIRFQTNNNAYVTYGNLITCAPGINANLGIDLSPATISGAAIKLANVQAIQFDTSTLQSNTDNGLDHSYGGTLQNRLLKTGGLQVHSVKVVGDRQTGWALPTGTLSRATFDQSTVTLAQLAQRVAGLVTDLYSGHGLIGA